MLKIMILGTCVLIIVLLATFWLVFDLNISYLNKKYVLCTLKKYFPVNKTGHNMILQSTLSFVF